MVCRGQNLTIRQSGTQDNIVHITHTCKDRLCIPLWTVGGVCVHSPATPGSARGRSLVRPYLDGCSWYPSTTSSSSQLCRSLAREEHRFLRLGDCSMERESTTEG